MRQIFNVLASVIIAFIIIVGGTSAKADVAQNVATDLAEGLSEKMRIAVQPLDHKSGRISRGIAAFIEESIISGIQRQAANRGYVLVERGKLQEIMREQEEFHNTEEFSKLIKQAGANVMVVISAQRRERTLVSVSARAIGVVGSRAGQVISASKTYNLKVKPKVLVNIKGVFKSNGQERKRYESSLISGLSTQDGVVLKPGAKDNRVDFIASAKLEVEVSDKVTEEARGSKVAQSMFGGMAKMGGPLGGMLSGITEATKDQGKYKVVNVTVTSQLKNSSDGGILISELSAIRDFPIDSQSEIGPAVKRLIKGLLKDTGAQLAAKSLGRSEPKRTVPETIKKAVSKDEVEDENSVNY
jgi:hypothetical protein